MSAPGSSARPSGGLGIMLQQFRENADEASPRFLLHLLASALGVRRGKAALSSGCKSHPATAPAGSNRSSYGGNEMAEAFG